MTRGDMTGSWAEQVLALAPTFHRAPSAHNTQPATLTAEGDAVVVGWDPDRELTVGDPTRRDLWLSLGAYVEAMSITAADAGLGVQVDWDVDGRSERVARLVRADPRPDPDGYTAAEVRSRRTARGPYAEPVVGASEVADLAVPAPARLDVVDPELVDQLLPLADRWSYGSPAQVAELRRWLRLHRGHPDYRRDGLNYEALAMTRLQARALRVVLAPTVWRRLSRLGGPALLASSSGIAKRGTVVAFSVPAAEARRPAQIGEHGRGLLRSWLAAGRRGLHVHPLSVLVDATVTAPRLHAAVSGGPRDHHIGSRTVLSVFRIGRAVDEPVESARR